MNYEPQFFHPYERRSIVRVRGVVAKLFYTHCRAIKLTYAVYVFTSYEYREFDISVLGYTIVFLYNDQIHGFELPKGSIAVPFRRGLLTIGTERSHDSRSHVKK